MTYLIFRKELGLCLRKLRAESMLGGQYTPECGEGFMLTFSLHCYMHCLSAYEVLTKISSRCKFVFQYFASPVGTLCAFSAFFVWDAKYLQMIIWTIQFGLLKLECVAAILYSEFLSDSVFFISKCQCKLKTECFGQWCFRWNSFKNVNERLEEQMQKITYSCSCILR